MPEEKKTVSIDQLDLLNQATAYGLLVRVLDDQNGRLFATKLSLGVPAIYTAVYLLDHNLGPEASRYATISFLDAHLYRDVLHTSPKRVPFPEWDPEDTFAPDCHPLADLFMLLYAWNLAAKQDELPPEEFLGPIFTLSGVVMEGLDRGFHVKDDNMRQLYSTYEEHFKSSMQNRADFDAKLREQFLALENLIEEARGKGGDA